MWANERAPAESWGVGMAFEFDRSKVISEIELQMFLMQNLAYCLAHMKEFESRLNMGNPVAVHLDECSKAYGEHQTTDTTKALILAIAGFKAAAEN